METRKVETYEIIFEFLKQNGVKEPLEDFIKEMFMYFANKALDERKINIFDKKVSGEIVAAILFAIGENVYLAEELSYIFNVSSLGSIFEYDGKVSIGKENLLEGSIMVDLENKIVSYEGRVLFEDKIVYDPAIKVIKFSEDLCKLVYQKVKNPLRKFISTLFLNSFIRRNIPISHFYPEPVLLFSPYRIEGSIRLNGY